MAPDVNGVGADGKWDYSTPGAGGYSIADFTLNDPSIRPVKVLCIGGGVSGILSAYQIQKYCQNVEFKAFEKNSEIGGTWLENRYPGAACDIPSHAYTYNFALNPDWPRYMALSADIWKYLDLICDTFDLRKKIAFNSEVIGAYWEEDRGQWRVKIRETKDGKEVRVYEETGDFLLHATGILNNFKFPDIEGINDFKGKVVHTARWPDDYQAEQWKNESVAVIGSGASSVQTVPNMQPYVKHMDVFVRTGVWFVQIASNYGQEQPYSDEQKKDFHENPQSLVKHAKEVEDQVNSLWGGFFSGSELQKQMHQFFHGRMSELIKDKKLLEGFTPKFGIGCRRVTPGDPYMEAIQKDNVDVHFTHVTKITEDGVIGADGVERKCNTIVCATGFDVSYRPRFPLVGRNGVDLRDKWKVCPEGYMGLAIPDMPNFLTFVGPTWPVENGSVMGPLNGVSEYAVQMIKKMQAENIHSYAPKQDVTDAFNEHAQEWIKHTVWKEDCRSWYRNNETGRVNAVWPGSSLHYLQAIRYPRYEDYEIRYKSLPEGLKSINGTAAFGKNMFAYLGSGFTLEGRQEGRDAGLDPSPYIQARYLDPKWLIATGTKPEVAREMVLNATAEAARREKEEDLDREAKGQGGSIYKSVRPRVL